MTNYTRGGNTTVHAYSHANLTLCYKSITTMQATDAPITCKKCLSSQ